MTIKTILVTGGTGFIGSSVVHRLVADGHIRIDVVLAMLAPDGAGLNTGPQLDYLADALPKARVVIAEINDQAPVTFGDTGVERAHIDHVLYSSRALPEMRGSGMVAIQDVPSRRMRGVRLKCFPSKSA